jgi:hypothetical protein
MVKSLRTAVLSLIAILAVSGLGSVSKSVSETSLLRSYSAKLIKKFVYHKNSIA